MEKCAKEAKRVISELCNVVREAERLRSDREFTSCLSGEISSSYLDHSLHNPNALFEITEDGNVYFSRISEKVVGSSNLICIPLCQAECSPLGVLEGQVDVFSLLTSLKEACAKERVKMVENLDTACQLFDKILVDHLKEAQKERKEDALVREAKEYLDLDIATKKSQLLEHLLKDKEKKHENI